MPPAATPADIEALDALAQRLMAKFAEAGYERIDPAVIQPAGLFLDVVGESLRARTYVFTDPDGAELCLRPDLTVPTCHLHLARHADPDTPARYCYGGSAFRYQPAGADKAHPREFHQAGIESFAARDRELDDAAVCGLIVGALRDAGIGTHVLRIGDVGLFAALISALPMPERWRRRLKHQFWRPEAFRAELMRLTTGASAHVPDLPAALLDRLDPGDPQAAEALVMEQLAQSGRELIGARTAREIADRLLGQVADMRETPLAPETAQLIEDYTSIRTSAGKVADAMAELVRGRKLDLADGLGAFQRRLGLLRKAAASAGELEFCAEFGRNLEYYTGFVFEVTAPALGAASPVAGGGRYDGLLAQVGAPRQVPAVGASIHTERLLAALQGTAP